MSRNNAKRNLPYTSSQSQPPEESRGFTQVPNSILRNSNLSQQARLIYAILLSYAWEKNNCFPSQETLSKDAGVTRQQVAKYIKELEDARLIDVERRGWTKSNKYIVRELPHVNSSLLPDVKQSLHQDVNSSLHEEYSLNNTHINNTNSEEKIFFKLISIKKKNENHSSNISNYREQQDPPLTKEKRKQNLEIIREAREKLLQQTSFDEPLSISAILAEVKDAQLDPGKRAEIEKELQWTALKNKERSNGSTHPNP